MTVLVTGGAGYIGSHTVLELVAAGEHVIVLDDLSTGSTENLPYMDNKRVTLVMGNAGDQGLVKNILAHERIDAVLHFAGSVDVAESVRNPLKYYSNNLLNSVNLLNALQGSEAKYFIFSSTAAVYGSENTSVREEDPLAPVSPYGASKAMFEQVLNDALVSGGPRYAALRYFNVAGADPQGRIGYSLKGQPTHLIRRAVRAALGIEPKFTIFGTDHPTHDGTCVRDFVHVADLAVAHVNALRYLREDGGSGVFNCGGLVGAGGARGYSVRQVIEVVKEESGSDFVVEYGEPRPGDIEEITADISKIQMYFDYQPRYTLSDMVQHELNWVRGSIVERIVNGLTSA